MLRLARHPSGMGTEQFMFGQLGQPWSRLAPRATWASREGRRLHSPRGGGLLRKVTGPRPEERAAEGLRRGLRPLCMAWSPLRASLPRFPQMCGAPHFSRSGRCLHGPCVQKRPFFLDTLTCLSPPPPWRPGAWHVAGAGPRMVLGTGRGAHMGIPGKASQVVSPVSWQLWNSPSPF